MARSIEGVDEMDLALSPSALCSFVPSRPTGPVNLPALSALLIDDEHWSYSRRDEISEEGRAMSNAIVGVNVFVPRTALPTGREGFSGLTVPIA